MELLPGNQSKATILTRGSFLRYYLGLLVFLLGITWYYYRSALDNYFAIDDYWFLMLSSGDVKTVLFGAPTLRLLGNVIFWCNYKLFGFSHTGYNAVSIAIHCVNVMLIACLLRRLFSDDKLAVVSAAVYAAMSVYCDAFLYKAAILTLTNLTFYTVVLMLYLKGREEKRYYIWSLLVFFFALFNKEEIASIPLVILLMELTVLGRSKDWRPVLTRVVPYAALICVYVAAMLLLSRSGILPNEQLERLSRFRIIHSLLGGFASLFVKPDGYITDRHQIIAYGVLILAVPIALLVSRKRGVLVFGFTWMFLTFLPQSYSSLSQFNPKDLFNSISRHLYIPSVGAAVVIAAVVLYSFQSERKLLVRGLVIVLLAGMVIYNAPLAQARCQMWRQEGEMMERFFRVLKFNLPVVEEGAYIAIDRLFAGRSYMSRALSAFYRNTVVFIEDPGMVDLATVPALYQIKNRIGQHGGLQIVKIK